MSGYSKRSKVKAELQEVLAKHYCTYDDAEVILKEFMEEIVAQGKENMIYPRTPKATTSDE